MIVKINNVDITNQVSFPNLQIKNQLSNTVDSAYFLVKYKDYVPRFNDEVEIYDNEVKIFGGRVIDITESTETIDEYKIYEVNCVDHTYELDSRLVARTYENKTIKYIIDDIISDYAEGFTSNNVVSDFTISKIVFNRIPVSQCLRRLADIVKFEWFIDPNKDVHFFPKFTELAPFDMTEGNYLTRSYIKNIDGSQLVNRVGVRGGEYDGALFNDTITVVGNETKSFKLPYRFANLVIELNGTPQIVGIDFINTFDDKDVLYNFQEQSINFENPLSDEDEIFFEGNPKVPVFANAQDPESIATYGLKEKMIVDRGIISNTIARRRASAELLTYVEEVVSGKFITYQSGLRAGQVIKNPDGEDMLIKSVDFKARTPFEFEYSVELISTQKYELIDILRKIVAPENEEINENEVSEDILNTNEDITITEEVNVVAPYAVEEDIEIDESYYTSDIEPIWVLAPYIPTAHNDPKRSGRLDLSMKLY